MKYLIIILLILFLVFSIEIELKEGIWVNKNTGQPIQVLRYEKDSGVKYKQNNEDFERTMSLKDLLTNYHLND